MNHYLTLREVTEKTGLPKSRLRYIEARFPVSINRRLFDSEGRFYSPNQLKTFRQIDRLLQNNNGSVLNELIQRNHAARRGRIITFTSGKGGVGKTSLSVNLSLLAQSRGFRTALLDGDLGMADAHALLGMRPSKNISNLFTEHIRLKEVMLETYGGLRFVPGCSGEFNIANLDDRCLNLLAEESPKQYRLARRGLPGGNRNHGFELDQRLR
jgi:DNA-binding transcriptional MerR regulator